MFVRHAEGALGGIAQCCCRHIQRGVLSYMPLRVCIIDYNIVSGMPQVCVDTPVALLWMIMWRYWLSCIVVVHVDLRYHPKCVQGCHLHVQQSHLLLMIIKPLHCLGSSFPASKQHQDPSRQLLRIHSVKHSIACLDRLTYGLQMQVNASSDHW